MQPLAKIARLLTVLAFYSPALHAQCCSPGNPSAGNQFLGTGGQGMLRGMSFYQYAVSNTSYQGEKIDTALHDTASYQFIGFNLDYGLTNRINAYLDLGYFPVRKNPGTKSSISGFSNGYIGSRFLLIPFRGKGLGLQTGLGLKFPLGMEPTLRDTILVTSEMQTSTHAFGYTLDVTVQKAWMPLGIRAILYGRQEGNLRNSENYQYGNHVSTSGFLTYSKWDWTLAQQFRLDWRGPDQKNTTEVSNSGSQVVWWESEMAYTFKPEFTLSLAGGVPVYRYYAGTQLGAGYLLSVKIRSELALFGPKI